MVENKLYLGIDYGGNAVKLGLITPEGVLAGKTSIPTQDLMEKSDCRSFANEIAQFVHGMGVYSSELGGIGLAIPGIFTDDTDQLFVPNVQANWPIFLDYLKQVFGKDEIATVNDANAAALGEMWMGAGDNAQSLLLVTIGSGLGSGLIVDGVVVSGGHGAAGEIGHMTVVPNGRLCKCGRKGCVERYASARGLVQTFTEKTRSKKMDHSKFTDIKPTSETDALSVFKAFELGDPRAEFALSDMADKLGFALAQVSCVADPEIILLGGGVALGADVFIKELRESFKNYALGSCASTPIRTASLESDAGIYGAARFSMLSHPHDNHERDWLHPDFGL